MPCRQSDGARGALRERRGAVGNAQPFRPLIVEVATIQRLRRLPLEEAMLAEALEPATVDFARCRQRAVGIEAQAGAAHAPVVDRRIAWSGIEGKQFALDAY